MKPGRNTIWLVPLFLLITYPLWSIPVTSFLAPRGDYDEETGGEEDTSHSFNMQTVKILQNQRGKDTAVIRATEAMTTDTPDVYLMMDVDADLYDNEGKITNVVAETGEYNSVSKLLTLRTDVVVNKIEKKQLLYTDLLYYSGADRTIRCPEKVKIVGEDVLIDGGSLDYDIKTKTYDISNRVHCILNGFVAP
jgi:LPS export ABC transporter protein LptC